MKLLPAREGESCDYCISKDGRCWCSLHQKVVKDMDRKRCKDWTDKENGRQENMRE